MNNYYKKFLVNLSLLGFLAGCGIQNNVNPAIQISENKTYFVAEKHQDFSNLYSFDFDTRKLELILSRPASGDAFVFQKMSKKNNLEGIYLAERFGGKPSRVTFFQADTKMNGIEHPNFPENIYNLIMVNNSLVGIGYANAEIISVSPALDRSYLLSTKLAIQNNLGQKNIELRNTAAHLLTANGKVFVLTIGSYLDINIKPYLLELASDLKTIVKQTEIPNCFNPANQVKVIDNSKFVLNCNPYSSTQSSVTNLIYVDVTNNIFIRELLRKDKNEINNQVKQFQIGGLSADKNAIFITERRQTANSMWEKIETSYWYNIDNPNQITLNDDSRKQFVNNLAGNVVYNYRKKKYLFNCVKDLATSTCLKGKAALSDNMLGTQSTMIDFNVPGVNEIKFPIPIYP